MNLRTRTLHRLYRWRAALACRLLGLGSLTAWWRNPETGQFEYLDGTTGKLEGGTQLNRSLNAQYDAGIWRGERKARRSS